MILPIRLFSILILDVDHFKSFNDKHGHLHGDEVLKYFSSSLHLSLVEKDNLAFRFGGDEFVVAFPGMTARQAYGQAVNLQKNIKSRMFLLKGNRFAMSFSGGVATYPDNAKNVEELLKKSDEALYCSKSNGRGRTTRYDQIFLERARHYLALGGLLIVLMASLYFYRQEAWALVQKIRQGGQTSQNGHPDVGMPPAIEASQEPLDEVFLRTGDILVGRILAETEDEIHMSLKLSHGTAHFPVKKKDVIKINKVAEGESKTKFVTDSSLNPPKE